MATTAAGDFIKLEFGQLDGLTNEVFHGFFLCEMRNPAAADRVNWITDLRAYILVIFCS